MRKIKLLFAKVCAQKTPGPTSAPLRKTLLIFSMFHPTLQGLLQPKMAPLRGSYHKKQKKV